jgi:hypothetical protein
MRTHRYRILRHYPEANITVTYGAFDCQNIGAAWQGRLPVHLRPLR